MRLDSSDGVLLSEGGKATAELNVVSTATSRGMPLLYEHTYYENCAWLTSNGMSKHLSESTKYINKVQEQEEFFV